MVAGDTQEAIDGIKTSFKGDKLIIENEGSSIQFGGINIGGISIGGTGGGVHININGQNIHISGNQNGGGHGRAVVGVAFPDGFPRPISNGQ